MDQSETTAPSSRTPPHSTEAEVAVLGAILISPEAINLVLGRLKPDDFYHERYGLIFGAMLRLEERGDPLDVVTVAEHLASREELERVGGISALSSLADTVPTAANIDYYARIIRDRALTRRTMDAAFRIITEGYGEIDDVQEYLDRAEQAVFEVGQERTTGQLIRIDGIVGDTFKTIENLYERKELITGVPTGFTDLDRMTAGFQPGDLIILAARPSMGKTTLALNMATNAALFGKVPVAVFSLEMSREQLVMRMLCSLSRVNSQRLRTGHLLDADIPKLYKSAGDLFNVPIYIDDSGYPTVMEIRSKCRRVKAESGGLGMVVIDYLQLMRSHDTKGESREQEISKITRSLKGLAKELNLPVVTLSQLNRSLERRPDKRPVMSDLRESGAIEQDADVILFIYRDEVYDPDSEEKGVAEVIIGKQRNGPTGEVKLKFFNEYTKFDNLMEESEA